MRLLIALLLLLLGAHSQTHQEACKYVGIQLAHLRSDCVDGLCLYLRSFHRDANGEEPRMSCIEALEIMGKFMERITEAASEDPDEKRRKIKPRTDGEKVAEILKSQVGGYLEALWHGMEPDKRSFYGALSYFVKEARIIAARDWGKWMVETVPFLMRSNQVSYTKMMLSQIVQISAATSALARTRKQLHTAAMYFAIDLEALLGHPVLSNASLAYCRVAAEPFEPGYRYRMYREFADRHVVGIPKDRFKVLERSLTIDRLAAAPENHNMTDLRALYDIFRGWDGAAKLATESLLRHQMENFLCPVIDRLFMNARSIPSDVRLKLVVTLIDLCEQTTPASKLRMATDCVGRGMLPGREPFLPPRINETIEFFSNESIPWTLGFPKNMDPRQALEVASTTSVYHIMTHGKLQEAGGGFFRFPIRWEAGYTTIAYSRAIGRAIGLAIRYQASLKVIKLSPPLVRALHPRMRPIYTIPISLAQNITQAGLSNPQILSQLIESADFVSRGISDVLGPGGFEGISDSVWMRAFGYAENEDIHEDHSL